MSVSSRPARVVPPLVRPEPLVMAAPPALGDAPAGGIPLQTLLPVVGSLSSITMIVVLRANPLMVLLGAVILMVALVSAVGMALTQRAGARRARHRERERFAEYLEELRQQCRAGHDKARAAAVAVHPGPEQLGVMVRHVERVWERRPGDADFLDARVGAGVVRWQEVVVPAVSDPLVQRDPMMDNAARVVSDAYSVVAGMPVWVPLASAMSVSVVGAPGVAHGVVRALLAQVVTWHSPADVRVAAVIPLPGMPSGRAYKCCRIAPVRGGMARCGNDGSLTIWRGWLRCWSLSLPLGRRRCCRVGAQGVFVAPMRFR